MLQNINVRAKFLLLICIPLLALIVLSGKQTMELYSVSQGMGQVMQLVKLTESSNNLIHEIQKERGFSAGFAASKGQNFSDTMRAQRAVSERALRQLRESLALFLIHAPDSPLRTQYAPVLNVLAQIGLVHEQIDALEMPPAKVIALYTTLVGDLQKTVSRARDACTNVSLYSGISNLITFINAKEFAGQERATLNAAFSSGSFSKEIFRAWMQRVALHEEYLRTFMENAQPIARNIYATKAVQPQQKVQAFRQKAIDNADKASLDVDAREWFVASTAYIDAMHDVEIAISGDLQSSTKSLQQEAQYSLNVSMGVTALIVGLTLLLAIFVQRSVTVPLLATVRFAGLVAAGDLSTPLTLNRRDEFGQLATSLNAMVRALQEIILKAETATQRALEETERAQKATNRAEEAQRQAELAKREGMRDAAGSIDTVAQALLNASNDISTSISQAANDAREQSQRLSSTATAMEEMTSTVLEVARNSAEAVQAADSARTQAQEGRAVVLDVVENINNAMKRSLDIRDAIGLLGQRVQSVDKVLGVISDIADQTNLLALNAAIEAARAGEAGRGFAVVADEVRKLAEKTMNATREVGQVLHGIQRDTEENIQTVDEAVLAMEKTTALTHASGAALEKIVVMVDISTDQVRSIATAAEEQSATSEEINHSVLDVNRLADETAKAMEQATHNVRTLLAQAKNLQGLIVALREEDGPKNT